MITRTDVAQTLTALDPATQPEDIERLWTTVSETMSTRNQEFYATMKESYRQVHGQIPDALTDEKIRNRAYMDAENSVRGQFLEPLTAQVISDDLETEAQQEELSVELLMQEPHAWKGEDAATLPMPQWALDHANDLWAEQTARFRATAAKRVNLADYLEQNYPSGPGELMNQWTQEISDYETAHARQMENLTNRSTS